MSRDAGRIAAGHDAHRRFEGGFPAAYAHLFCACLLGWRYFACCTKRDGYQCPSCALGRWK